jgi:hypothetical protein
MNLILNRKSSNEDYPPHTLYFAKNTPSRNGATDNRDLLSYKSLNTHLRMITLGKQARIIKTSLAFDTTTFLRSAWRSERVEG